MSGWAIIFRRSLYILSMWFGGLWLLWRYVPLPTDTVLPFGGLRGVVGFELCLGGPMVWLLVLIGSLDRGSRTKTNLTSGDKTVAVTARELARACRIWAITFLLSSGVYAALSGWAAGLDRDQYLWLAIAIFPGFSGIVFVVYYSFWLSLRWEERRQSKRA